MDLTLTMRRLAPVLMTTGFLSASLGGCSWFHHGSDTAKVVPPPPACPTVLIIPELAQASQFDGAATGYSNLTYSASLGALNYHCSFDKTGINIDATVSLTAQQGPKAQGGTLEFPYFVAILDPAGDVMAKSVFATPLKVAPLQVRAGSKEFIHEFIPLRDKSDAGSYGVVIGFQLDQRQVDFNRSTGVGE